MNSLIVYNSPYPKKRIGRPYDGGYVICDLSGVVEYDHFVSGGLKDDVSFECEFLDRHPTLNCDAFDGTIDELPADHSRLDFHKMNIGNANTDTCTDLTAYISGKNNVFMKMDIEGHEFRVLPILMANGLIKNIAQLVLEVHTAADIQLHPDYFKGLSDITHDVMFNTLSKLCDTHVLVHLHPNNYCRVHYIDGIKVPNVFECTYIRKADGMSYTRNTSPIPSSIDMRNIANFPELTLEGYPYVHQ